VRKPVRNAAFRSGERCGLFCGWRRHLSNPFYELENPDHMQAGEAGTANGLTSLKNFISLRAPSPQQELM
jgi:hypothetical protein